QHFTRRSDFESFGDSFPRLGDTSVFGHRGGDGKGEPPFGKVFLSPIVRVLTNSSQSCYQKWESENLRISKIKVVLTIMDC
ncbi:MAG: hypothetical protein ACO1TE_28670, partial [Prosthecobacter sp.]